MTAKKSVNGCFSSVITVLTTFDKAVTNFMDRPLRIVGDPTPYGSWYFDAMCLTLPGAWTPKSSNKT